MPLHGSFRFRLFPQRLRHLNPPLGHRCIGGASVRSEARIQSQILRVENVYGQPRRRRFIGLPHVGRTENHEDAHFAPLKARSGPRPEANRERHPPQPSRANYEECFSWGYPCVAFTPKTGARIGIRPERKRPPSASKPREVVYPPRTPRWQ